MPDNVGFIISLPHRRSFSPDAAFWTGARLTRKFPEEAPIFAVEVRSPEHYGTRAPFASIAPRTLPGWSMPVDNLYPPE